MHQAAAKPQVLPELRDALLVCDCVLRNRRLLVILDKCLYDLVRIAACSFSESNVCIRGAYWDIMTRQSYQQTPSLYVLPFRGSHVHTFRVRVVQEGAADMKCCWSAGKHIESGRG